MQLSMTIRPKTKSCRVTCNWNCKALQHVQNAQWPRETCNYLQYCPRQRVVDLPVAVTVRPCCSKCTVTKRDMQLSMTIRPKTKSCSCDCKALMLFRTRSVPSTRWAQWLRESCRSTTENQMVQITTLQNANTYINNTAALLHNTLDATLCE